MSEPTVKYISEFMLEHLRKEGVLYQEIIVYLIQDRFGSSFVYDNGNGNLAINRGVLKEFMELTNGDVVWNKSERFWRFREDYDDAESRIVNS